MIFFDSKYTNGEINMPSSSDVQEAVDLRLRTPERVSLFRGKFPHGAGEVGFDKKFREGIDAPFIRPSASFVFGYTDSEFTMRLYGNANPNIRYYVNRSGSQVIAHHLIGDTIFEWHIDISMTENLPGIKVTPERNAFYCVPNEESLSYVLDSFNFVVSDILEVHNRRMYPNTKVRVRNQ